MEGKGSEAAFFDKPKNVKVLMYIFYSLCALLLILDLVVHRHTYHSWEELTGFYAIFGFIGCVVLVLLATWMRTWIIRPEDYYQNQASNSKLSKKDDEFSVGSDS